MTREEIKAAIEEWFVDAATDENLFGISEMYALLYSEGKRNLRYWSDRYRYVRTDEDSEN
ncbi:MAG: hypothetical protein RR370_03675 [Synergistaceae bacterium]